MEMKKIIAVAFTVFTFSQVIFGQTYYVDRNNTNAADDASHGSEAMPWKTIQYGVNQLAAGCTLIVKPGNYDERITMSKTGTAGNYIVIKGANAVSKSHVDTSLIFDRKNPVPGPIDSINNAICRGFKIYGKSYIKIENFEIAYQNKTHGGVAAIDLISASYIEIRNNFIHDCCYGGGVRARDNFNSQYVTISGNMFYRVCETIISIMGINWLVENNDISHANGYNTITGEYGGGDSNGMTFTGSGHVIRNNYIHDFLNKLDEEGKPQEATGHPDAIQIYSVHEIQWANNVLIDHNIFHNISQMLLSQDIREQDGLGNNIHHIRFMNNVFYRSTGSMFMVGYSSDRFSVINNTFIDGGAIFSAYSDHAIVLNNIFCKTSTRSFSQLSDKTCRRGSIWDYNIYYPYDTYPVRVPEYDSNSIFWQDPEFVDVENLLGPDNIPFTDDDGLRLQNSSPAKGTGFGGFDMGAYGNFTDNASPSVPSGLNAVEVADYSASISWNPSTDNYGVYEYVVYRDGQLLDFVDTTFYVDESVTEATAYNYTVSAIDIGGNESAQSSILSITTSADILPPSISEVSYSCQLDTVIVIFSEPVDEVSAETAGNYSVSNGITVTGAVLRSDLRTVTLEVEPLLTDGQKYVLTVNNIKDRAKSPNTIVSNSWMNFFANVLLTEYFTDGDRNGWTVVDLGDRYSPSEWVVQADDYGNNRLRQNTSISRLSDPLCWHGTYLFWNDSAAFHWKNYSIKFLFKSNDNDDIGVMFRLKDTNNYYLYQMSNNGLYRRLSKIIDGNYNILAEVKEGYRAGELFQHFLEARVKDDSIRVLLDGEDIFGEVIIDNSLTSGTVGLFCYHNHAAMFDSIEVRGYIVDFENGSSAVDIALPGKFELYQNYPNPFNPDTKIIYELPMKDNVVLKVYNILGQEVKTLVNEVQTPGRHEYIFDASNLASGVYFYKIVTGKNISIKKMVFLK